MLKTEIIESTSRGIIYISNKRAMFMGPSVDTSLHQHHAIQITIGIEKPFQLKHREVWHESRLLVIDSGQAHQFIANGLSIIILLEPESEEGKHIKQIVLNKDKLRFLDIKLIEPLLVELLQNFEKYISYQYLEELCNRIISTFTGIKLIERKLDPRIKDVLEILKHLQKKEISFKELAKMIYLSESRLLHLFKEELEIPFRQYLLWLRLKEALIFITEGRTLTEAAHEAGFSDSAHLSRTFRAMFGMKTSEIFKNSQFIQVLVSPN